MSLAMSIPSMKHLSVEKSGRLTRPESNGPTPSWFSAVRLRQDSDDDHEEYMLELEEVNDVEDESMTSQVQKAALSRLRQIRRFFGQKRMICIRDMFNGSWAWGRIGRVLVPRCDKHGKRGFILRASVTPARGRREYYYIKYGIELDRYWRGRLTVSD